jgi:hypothetical protein
LVGWNTIYNINGCRGLQFHSSPIGPGTGFNQYDLHVHDNLIHNVRCSGINFATVDPSKGVVEAYNNVIYHVGIGPTPSDGGGQFAGIEIAGECEAGTVSSGSVHLYNNTLYDNGPGAPSGGGGAVNYYGNTPGANCGSVSSNMSVTLTNNLVLQKTGETYLDSAGNDFTSFLGSNNGWSGLGAGPSQTTANVGSDPSFVNAGASDFHLQSDSRAIGAGTLVGGLLEDFDGVARPNPPAIGAYE